MSTERPQLAVGVVVFDDQGRVLLVQRGQEPSRGQWTIPGGRVERGETVPQACLRELLSETGVSARLGPLVDVYEFIDERFHYVVLDYVASEPHGQVQAGEDAADAGFFTLEELQRLPITAGLLPMLEKARQRLRG